MTRHYCRHGGTCYRLQAIPADRSRATLRDVVEIAASIAAGLFLAYALLVAWLAGAA